MRDLFEHQNLYFILPPSPSSEDNPWLDRPNTIGREHWKLPLALDRTTVMQRRHSLANGGGTLNPSTRMFARGARSADDFRLLIGWI